MHSIGLNTTLKAYAHEHDLHLTENEHYYELTWRATAEERYIRIDKPHGLVDAGIKRETQYETATNLGLLGANGLPNENLDYYRTAANKHVRR